MSKHQFTGLSKPRRFFDRKIIDMGNSKVLAITKVIPAEWTYVRIWKIKEKPNKVVLHIEKLLADEQHAQTNATDKDSKQDT